jgi:AraC-like DNA-binding protein
LDLEIYEHLNPNIFLFVERKDTPDWKLEKRQSGFHELYFLVGGKSVYHVNEEIISAQAGDIVYIPGGSVRYAYTISHSPMHAYVFNFHWLSDNHVSLPFELLMKNKITDELAGCLKEMSHIWTKQKPFYRIRVRSQFLLILYQLFNLNFQNSQIHEDSRVKKIMDYVSEHYSENLDLDVMARLTHLHPVYLGKLFKKKTGTTFKEYLNRVRVGHAEKLLLAGGFTVSEVAEKCGFSDISYFSKVFKKTKGCSPSFVSKKL